MICTIFSFDGGYSSAASSIYMDEMIRLQDAGGYIIVVGANKT